MMLFGHDETVAGWVSSKVNKDFQKPFTSIGVLNSDGRLIGGFVFNDFTGSSIEMSIAGKGVFSRGIWRGVINYVFGQLKCSRLQMHTNENNKQVKKLAPRLGFTFEGKSRNFYGKDGACVYSLVKADLDAFQSRWRL